MKFNQANASLFIKLRQATAINTPVEPTLTRPHLAAVPDRRQAGSAAHLCSKVHQRLSVNACISEEEEDPLSPTLLQLNY